jgi:hypothetical protein
MKLLTWPNISFLLLATFGVIIFLTQNPKMEAPQASLRIEDLCIYTQDPSIRAEEVKAALDSAKVELKQLSKSKSIKYERAN